MPEITRENIKSFLKTRKDNRYYFKFPWMPEGYKTLICEVEGLMRYWTNRDEIDKSKAFRINFDLMRKDSVFDEAFEAYQKEIKKLKRR